MYNLVGIDGNAYSVIGYVQNAMKECGMSKDDIDDYLDDATSGDYNHLLTVSMGVLDLCNEISE